MTAVTIITFISSLPPCTWQSSEIYSKVDLRTLDDNISWDCDFGIESGSFAH